MKPFPRYMLVAGAIIALDQAVKLMVKLNMRLEEEIPLIGNLFKIYFIENKGAAFGMTLSNMLGFVSDEVGKLILSLFSIVAVVVIVYFLYRIATQQNRLPLYVALILGGAVGNIIDRVFYGVFFQSINHYEGGLMHGRVVDMFYFDVYNGPLPQWIPFFGGTDVFLWPIFNIADAAISIGIIAILWNQKHYFTQETPPAAQALPTATEPLAE